MRLTHPPAGNLKTLPVRIVSVSASSRSWRRWQAQDRGVRRTLRCLTMDPAVARPAVDDPHPVQFRPLCLFHLVGGTRPGFAVPFHMTPPSCGAASQPPVKSRQTQDDCLCHAILPRRHGALMSASQASSGPAALKRRPRRLGAMGWS